MNHENYFIQQISNYFVFNQKMVRGNLIIDSLKKNGNIIEYLSESYKSNKAIAKEVIS